MSSLFGSVHHPIVLLSTVILAVHAGFIQASEHSCRRAQDFRHFGLIVGYRCHSFHDAFEIVQKQRSFSMICKDVEAFH